MKAALFALMLVVFPVLGPGLAHAATTEEIFALYARGDYAQAIRAGEAARTAPGLAIAARAALAAAVLRETPCLSCLERAEQLARAAIAADPHFSDGHVWLAVALGHQARIIGKVRARLNDSPGQSKAALDAALADSPGNPYAVSALGGWHIEIVRGGGAYLAGLLYDASEREGLLLFDRAVRLAPGNVAVHYQIALSLAGFDAGKYRARITTELKAAIACNAATAYERRMQSRAGDLLGLLETKAQDAASEAFAARVRHYQGYAG